MTHFSIIFWIAALIYLAIAIYIFYSLYKEDKKRNPLRTNYYFIDGIACLFWLPLLVIGFFLDDDEDENP